MTIEVIIFDKDGILVDTEPLHYEAYRRAAAEFGLKLSEELYYAYCVAGDYKTFLPQVFSDRLDPSKLDELHDKKLECYNELRKGIKPVKGIQDLIQRLYKYYRLAIASTTSVQSVHEDLKVAGINEELFEVKASGKDYSKNKPAPDVYLGVANLMQLPPEYCLAIEDSPNGVLSAKSANMICIARINPHILEVNKEYKSKLEQAGADKIIKTYDEITLKLIDSLSTTNC